MLVLPKLHFTDTHCHLDFPELLAKIKPLLDNCSQQNIHQIIIPSVSPDNWESILSLTQHYSSPNCSLFAAYGIHPWYLKSLTHDALAALAHRVEQCSNSIIAIGETGIDGKIAEEQDNLKKQIEFFEFHITLANKHNLPLIIHHRKSHQQIVPLIKKHVVKKVGVIHAFSGSYQQAKTYLDLGYKLGIGGTITYPRAEKTIKTLKKIPLESILLETDAPSMPLYGYQGEPNSPLKLITVFDRLCELRNESPEEIVFQLEKNKKDLFNI